MKILQVSPNVLNLNENMTYGGIERLVIALKEQYDLRGLENYVIAPGGDNSIPNVFPSLFESYWASIKRDSKFQSPGNAVFNNLAHISKVLEIANASDVDIVHDHTGKVFPFHKSLNKPLLTTLHGPSEWFWDRDLYKEFFKGCIFNAVSESQRQDYHFLNPQYIVYNGLGLKSFPFSSSRGSYLFSLGQITRHKGQHHAIAVAEKTGLDLIIAGNISEDPTDSEDRAYFDNEIRPHLGDSIKYVGELNDEQKKVFFRDAYAFLMPISCNEAFGLVVIESLACGTPVISFSRGAIPEIIEHGKNGFLVEDAEEMTRYLSRIDEIDRGYCRKSVLNKFDIGLISEKYIQVYEDVIRRAK